MRVICADAETRMVAAVEQFDKLVLDLQSLDYVSSAGLRAIKRAIAAMRRKGGTLLVKNASKPIMDVFEMTGFVIILKFIWPNERSTMDDVQYTYENGKNTLTILKHL